MMETQDLDASNDPSPEKIKNPEERKVIDRDKSREQRPDAPRDEEDRKASQTGIPDPEQRSPEHPDSPGLEKGDGEGTPLNEGPDDEDFFDTGEDLDVSKEELFPDEDPESEDP